MFSLKAMAGFVSYASVTAFPWEGTEIRCRKWLILWFSTAASHSRLLCGSQSVFPPFAPLPGAETLRSNLDTVVSCAAVGDHLILYKATP